MLPLTRNTNYSPATAVRSADLNDLQDAIVGGLHGAVEIPMGPASFAKVSGAATLNAATGFWVGIGVFMATIPIPPGSSIVGVKWHYDRGGAGTMTLTGRQRTGIGAVTDGVIVSVASGTGAVLDAAATAAAITSAGLNPDVPVGQGEFWFTVEHDDVANKFGGLFVTCTRPG